jgi:hypothetical protein
MFLILSLSFMVFSSTKLENRKGEQVLLGRQSAVGTGEEEVVEKG